MSIKAKRRCPSCHGSKIGYLEDVRDSSVDRLVVGRSRRGLLRQNIGTIEAYVCTECGYYQPFVKDPASVAFDEVEGFRWLEQPGRVKQGPYR